MGDNLLTYRVRRAALGPILAMVLAGCLTRRGGDEVKLTERDPLASDEGTDIPVALWSPEQRRMQAGYYFLAGEVLGLKGDVQASRGFFNAAYNLEPGPTLGAKKILADARAGQGERALLDARRMVILYPKSGDLHHIYGELQLAVARNVSEGTTALERAIALDPGLEAAYLRLMEVLQDQKKWDDAISWGRELVVRRPGSTSAWLALAKMLITRDRAKEAMGPATRAYELEPQNPIVAVIYGLTLELNGRSKEAITVYEQLYLQNPTNEELIRRMVNLYREMGGLDRALSILDELATQSAEGAADGRRPVGIEVQRAFILWEMGRFVEASALLDQLSSEYPDAERLRYMAGLGRERLGDVEGALSLYRTFDEQSSLRRMAQARMIMALKEAERLGEAADVFQAMLREAKAPDELAPELYEVGASVYGDMKDFDHAREVVDRAYAAHPKNHRLLFLRGVYEERAGRIPECIETMRMVVARDSTMSSAMNYLGYLFAERGENLDEAEMLITRALEIKPDDGFYLDSLGWVYYQKGLYDRALETLEKALALTPDEGVVLEHLADTWRKKGDEAKAQELYRQALEKKLEDRDRQRIESKMHPARP